MSQAPPNCTVPTTSKIFTVTKVDEKSGESSNEETKKFLKKLPKIDLRFFYLANLTTNVKFSKQLSSRKSLKFADLADEVENEFREIFESIDECKVVGVTSKYFGRKSTSILILSSRVELKTKGVSEKLEKVGKNEDSVKLKVEKFEKLDKEMFEHYKKFGRKLCNSCSE
jgi:hypothetical protein